MKVFEIIVKVALIFMCSLFSVQGILYVALSQYEWIYEFGLRKSDAVVMTLLFMLVVFALTIFVLIKFKKYIIK